MAWIKAKRREGGTYYYVVARAPEKGRNGRRWIYGGRTPEEAEIRLREVELALARHESLKRRHGEFPKVSVLVGEFVKYAHLNLSWATADRYERSLAIFRAFLKDDPLVDRITPATLEAFKASRREVRYNTLRNDYMALRALFAWAKRLGYCEDKPTDRVSLRNPEHRKPPAFLSKGEVERLLEVTAHNPKHHALVATLLYAGLRSGELCRLRWGDVDLERGCLRVQGKGGKHRTVPVGEGLREMLEALPQSDGYVFQTRAGKPYGKESLRKIFGRAGRIMGRHLHPHMLRHTYATHLMASCRNPAIVQQALGHSSITTTMIYAHVTLDLLAQAVQGLDYKAPPKALPAAEVA